MFHCFHDVMHQLKDADTETLELVLSFTHPHILGIETVDELKKYYWIWADRAEKGLDKIRQRQFHYFQSRSEIDKILMEHAEQDYKGQLDALRTFSQFYACHHYLGTAGFESVSLD